MGRQENKAAVAVSERDANRVIEEQLAERVRSLESAGESDVLFYSGLIYPMASDVFKDALEALPEKKQEIIVLLETAGGLIHVAARIAKILRHHYKRVAFLVPSEAMSAGTILVMSGDSIYMDYASMLGPIDPQIRGSGGSLVPALGYLEQYDRLIGKADEGRLNSAELAYLLENFDPAELYQYEQEKELSIVLLEEWLAKYKFKNWKKTESTGKKVTPQMKRERAADIARKLNDTNRWHSHSRGIPIEVLRRDLKLQIDDFGDDDVLGPAVQSYYHLLKDYSLKRGNFQVVLHTRERYVGW
jgi:membrane-bound ClpP family serine protease